MAATSRIEHARRSLRDDIGQLGLAREQDEVDGPVGEAPKRDRERADHEPGDDQQPGGAQARLHRDPMRQVADRDDEHGDDGGHEQTPGQVRQAQGLVRRERRQRQIRLVQPVPTRDAGEDDRSRPCRYEPRQERAADLLRGDLPARRGHLEQEKRGDQRASEERSDRRERTGEREELSSGALQSNQSHRQRTETETERDQRRLRAEDEPETQCRQCCGKDACERDRGNRIGPETFQRRVTAVAGQPNGRGDQQSGEPGYEDDVPPGRLAPAELLGDDVPHEMDDVVDRGLEQHGRERDGHAEQRGEGERSDVRHRFRVAHGSTLMRLEDRSRESKADVRAAGQG